jgi:hypothetical protein
LAGDRNLGVACERKWYRGGGLDGPKIDGTGGWGLDRFGFRLRFRFRFRFGFGFRFGLRCDWRGGRGLGFERWSRFNRGRLHFRWCEHRRFHASGRRWRSGLQQCRWG